MKGLDITPLRQRSKFRTSPLVVPNGLADFCFGVHDEGTVAGRGRITP